MSPTGGATTGAKPAAKTNAGGDPFANLAIGGSKKGPAQKGPTMADMAKQKASAGIWGTPAGQSSGGGDLI